MPSIDFWYEFASNYAYLAAARIEALADRAGVTVRWRPFLLGPVFAAQGLNTSPFKIYPIKGRNMIRDMERQCAAIGRPFRLPDPFPQNGLSAARIALVAIDEGWGPAFTNAVYSAEFVEGRTISDKTLLADIVTGLDRDPDAVFAAAETPDNKARLKAQTEEALRIGLFGAPTFVTEDGELFWGNDRLEQALHWARHGSLSGL
ncbi:2-hydroxychromene-2-carboxylate isomerase [Microbaculum marinisediminis]|uniref:2-hydroxychromene-2-carboxylate isomerase n=1 Tax=Microbaculum marinisediminis TaxID=2931392 RepID=A0AAW5R0U4_9HYPH|nr:2-hydroxychromene-2-carboxylate isomerase [Microbaculum sp. A6E488]MCT8972316.1 2-hydroxychromene-2-carboxylate isomerase [Microbaculum sp. A6E488]